MRPLIPGADPDMTAEFVWACDWTGLLDPAIAPRLSAVAGPMYQRQIRDRLIHRAMIAVDGFTAALTGKGDDERDAAEFVLLNAATQWTRRYHLSVAKRRSDWLVGIIIAGDNRDCAAAKTVHRHCYRQGEEPALPLPTCDAKHCRCSYQAVVPSTAARHCVNL